MDWIRGELLWVRAGREPQGAVYVVRKALGKAVVRNKMKRRLRQLYRECRPVAGSVVILVRPAAVQSSYADLGSELSDLLERLKIAPSRATP